MIGKLLALVGNRAVGYGLLIIALLVATNYATFKLWRAADERGDAAVDALASERANARIVVRVVEVQKEVIRRVPVIQRELVRLCERAVEPPAGGADGAPEAETGDVPARRLQDLGTEVADSLQELEAYVGLQEWASKRRCK